jgi:hypothetical protein
VADRIKLKKIRNLYLPCNLQTGEKHFSLDFFLQDFFSSTGLRLSRLIISLRVEVSLFVLSPEIEDRNEVEVGTGHILFL